MRRSLLVGGLAVALVGCAWLVMGYSVDPGRASYAYLFAFTYVFTVVIGALFLLMTGHACDARWFVAIRRYVEHVTGTMPLFALLFVPILFCRHSLYPWTNPSSLSAHDREFVSKKVAYLNVPFFVARTALYFVVFIAIAELLRRWSLRQDRQRDGAERLRSRMIALSAGGLPVVSLALTFASFDWFMSLEPTWYSNVYGVYIFAGGFVSALGLFGALVVLARALGALPPGVSDEHFSAVGRLELAMIIFWTYIAYVQLFITWIADMPLKVSWYVVRFQGGWQWLGVALLLFHWAVPFFYLLQRKLKRRSEAFFAVSSYIVLVHLLDVYYLVLPAHDRVMQFRTVDLAAVAAITGAVIAFAAFRAGGVDTHPVHDPALDESLRYEAT
jgi:hypothetical protein